MSRRVVLQGTAACWLTWGLLGAAAGWAAEPVALRIENLTVPPSSGPVMGALVKNLSNAPYNGTVTLTPPDGWQLSPAERKVSIAPGETAEVPFSIVEGTNVAANAYPFTVTAASNGTTVTRRQTVFVATAPYFKPTIDGDPTDWNHAVPVRWETDGRATIVRTYWSRRRFALLVEVDEEKLVSRPESNAAGPAKFDAVQIAIAPEGAVTDDSPDQRAERFEFLIAAAEGSDEGRCFQLAQPGMKLAEAARPRALPPLACDDADVAVSRRGTTTIYECSFSFRPMRDHIKPTEGREFCFSVLVHDAEGTGLRDLGVAANLWPQQRNPLGWSRFQGDSRGEQPPWDSKLNWGMCSSLY